MQQIIYVVSKLLIFLKDMLKSSYISGGQIVPFIFKEKVLLTFPLMIVAYKNQSGSMNLDSGALHPFLHFIPKLR